MENSTIQKDIYSFCSEYTDNTPTIYENLKLQEIEAPIKERILSLNKCETRYIKDIDFKTKAIANLKSNNNFLNYTVESLNWIGYVIEIGEMSFTAKLTNCNENTTYEIANFNKRDVAESDLNLLAIGATFYWSVGRRYQSGQVIKQSFIRFKRSVNLDVNEFDLIIDKARTLNETILWE